MVNMLVVSQVARKMGPAAAAEANLTTEESDKLEKPATRVLEKYLPRLSPEWALLATAVIIYGNKFANIQLAKAGITQEEALRMAQEHAANLRKAADARANGAAAEQPAA